MEIIHGECDVTKTKSGKELDYGAHVYGEKRFDAWNIRRHAYTRKNEQQILTEILGGNSDKKIISDKQVSRRRSNNKNNKKK